MAFVRSGKTLSRCANVAIQGFMQGGSGSTPTGTGAQGGGEIEMTSMPSSISKGASKLDLDDSFDIGRRSTAGSLTDVTQSAGTMAAQKGLKAPAIGLKSVLISTNAFGFGCRVTELFLLLNYYSEAHQDAENVSVQQLHYVPKEGVH
jgi:hypothetical protein